MFKLLSCAAMSDLEEAVYVMAWSLVFLGFSLALGQSLVP